MGNADTIATGGVTSSVGPVLMRKLAPLTVDSKDIITTELDLYKDSTFSSVSDDLTNISFGLSTAATYSSMARSVQTVSAQLAKSITQAD